MPHKDLHLRQNTNYIKENLQLLQKENIFDVLSSLDGKIFAKAAH